MVHGSLDFLLIPLLHILSLFQTSYANQQMHRNVTTHPRQLDPQGAQRQVPNANDTTYLRQLETQLVGIGRSKVVLCFPKQFSTKDGGIHVPSVSHQTAIKTKSSTVCLCELLLKEWHAMMEWAGVTPSTWRYVSQVCVEIVGWPSRQVNNPNENSSSELTIFVIPLFPNGFANICHAFWNPHPEGSIPFQLN